MLILALDSTAVVATAALCEDQTVLASETISCGRTHSETLLPMIERLYKKVGRLPKDTDLFACSVGPGSFTGVRIGVATIKGLAFGGKKCVGVSTLEALAYNLSDQEGLVCPVMDARRGQLYNALFRVSGGTVSRLCEDRVIQLEDLAKALSFYKEPIFFCGDGYTLAREGICLENVRETPQERIDQNGVSVARLALGVFQQGNFVTDSALRPLYLRAPQAERERNERLQKEREAGKLS